jgi:hypothetical protein
VWLTEFTLLFTFFVVPCSIALEHSHGRTATTWGFVRSFARPVFVFASKVPLFRPPFSMDLSPNNLAPSCSSCPAIFSAALNFKELWPNQSLKSARYLQRAARLCVRPPRGRGPFLAAADRLPHEPQLSSALLSRDRRRHTVKDGGRRGSDFVCRRAKPEEASAQFGWISLLEAGGSGCALTLLDALQGT